jgi:hypothetical protein
MQLCGKQTKKNSETQKRARSVDQMSQNDKDWLDAKGLHDRTRNYPTGDAASRKYECHGKLLESVMND